MTLIAFTLMSITMLLISIFSPHPLILTIKVLVLATSLCLTLAHTTTWYAYMLYMIMVGGMLVMFTYISSLSPNSIFSLKPQMLHLLLVGVVAYYTAYATASVPNTVNTQNHQNAPENFITFFALQENTSLLIFLVTMLLLAMVISMTLLSQKKASMRPTMSLSSPMK